MNRKVVLVVTGLVVCVVVMALAVAVRPKEQAVWERPCIPRHLVPGYPPDGRIPDNVATAVHAQIRLYDAAQQMIADAERTNRWGEVCARLRKMNFRDFRDAMRLLRGEPSAMLTIKRGQIRFLCERVGSPPEWLTNTSAKVQGP